MTYLEKLIANNTGVSSKNFFLVVVTIIGCLLLLVPVFALSIEVFFTHTIATDLSAMAAYVGSVASLFATAGITKAWSEKFEKSGKPTFFKNKEQEFEQMTEEEATPEEE
jgi:uncharacterized membrane protein